MSPPRPLTAHWPQPQPARPPQAPASPRPGLRLTSRLARPGLPWPGHSIPSESRARPGLSPESDQTPANNGHLVTQRPQSQSQDHVLCSGCSPGVLMMMQCGLSVSHYCRPQTSSQTPDSGPGAPVRCSSSAWHQTRAFEMCDSSCLSVPHSSESDAEHNEYNAPWHCVVIMVLPQCSTVLSERCVMITITITLALISFPWLPGN